MKDGDTNEDTDCDTINSWYITDLSILKNHKTTPSFKLGCSYCLGIINNIVKTEDNNCLVSWYNEDQFKITNDDYSIMFKRIL
jgi:hypothetical protein